MTSDATAHTITGAWIMERIEALALHTEVPGQITRTYLSPAQRSAGEMLIGWMAEAGMAADFDAAGNVIGRYEGAAPGAPALMIGSHYDSVVDAGRFDGPYGVVAAIAAVDQLNRAGRRLPLAIEVVAFAEEEGVRYKATLIGSRAVAGTLHADILQLVDAQGVTLDDARTAFHGRHRPIESAARQANEIAGFLELHIEQGPVLEGEGLPVGVVTGIAGASRFSITVRGAAGHAGTVPMGLRRDAAVGTAEIIMAVESICTTAGDVVGTVGVVTTPGGAANVIPGRVDLSLDVRSISDVSRDSALERIRAAIYEIAERRHLKVDLVPTHDASAVLCDADLQAAFAHAIIARGQAVRQLPSGAGHDAMAMATLCPVAMLFVRCGNGGISHSPAETMTAADAEFGAQILLDAIVRLCGARPTQS